MSTPTPVPGAGTSSVNLRTAGWIRLSPWLHVESPGSFRNTDVWLSPLGRQGVRFLKSPPSDLIR